VSEVTRCPRGHLLDEAGLYINPTNGHRICRACHNRYQERRAEERRTERAAREIEPGQEFGARPQHLACRECRRTPLTGYLDAEGTRFRCAFCHSGTEIPPNVLLPEYMTPPGCRMPDGSIKR